MKKKPKKKGETLHHLSYKPEITVLLPSKGSHLVLTSFQSMAATKRNIKYLKDYIKAVKYILNQKSKSLKGIKINGIINKWKHQKLKKNT